jgi:hypothetical protein
MADTQTITGMRSRLVQLHRIADMAHSQEIRDLVLKVAHEIQIEINRLEAREVAAGDSKMPMPPQA